MFEKAVIKADSPLEHRPKRWPILVQCVQTLRRGETSSRHSCVYSANKTLWLIQKEDESDSGAGPLDAKASEWQALCPNYALHMAKIGMRSKDALAHVEELR